MQDLDIRGAGNLLGAEQSGFISDLGYETYQKILNEAMAELKSEELRVKSEEGIARRPEGESPFPTGQRAGANSKSAANSTLDVAAANSSLFTLHSSLWVADCSLESDLEMYFPDQYVPSDSERMLLYRELDNVRNDEELAAYRTRLVDRFGPVPPCGEELMQVVPLRRMGKALGCEKIMLKQGRMFLYFISNPDSPYYQSAAFGRVINYATQNVRRCNLREQNGKRSMVVTDVPSVGEAVAVLSGMSTS
jgi:transcription-repair coupling factor (superfamily II helicase)